MSLTGVITNQIDGQLGIGNSSATQTAVIIGCSVSGIVGVPLSIGSQTQLVAAFGAGKLVEDGAFILANGGSPQWFMPVNPSIAGAISTPVHSGTGTGTLSISAAPHAALTFTVSLGGALNTAKVTIQVGTGAISQPVLLPTGGVLAVPGTYAVGTFAAGTYVIGDTYTVSTAGVVAHTGSGAPANPTFTASPLDDYALVVNMTTGGANGTAAFTYSLDGGTDTSAPIVTPGTGIYAIPNSGIVLTFASTQTAGDAWTAQAAAPSFSGSDLAACTTALSTTYLGTTRYSLLYVDRYATTAAAAVTEVSALQTFALGLKTSGVFVRAIGCVPTVGSININAGAVQIDSADTDSVIATAFQSVVAEHVAMAGGDTAVYLPNSGLTLRRNAGLLAISRALAFEASASIGEVGKGGQNVVGIFRDEGATPALQAARLLCLGTYGAYPGIYFAGPGTTLALPTSDYAPLANARVVDEASGIAFSTAMPLVNSKIQLSPKITGAISARAAGRLDAKMNSALDAAMVSTSPQDATAVLAATDRTHNIVADGKVIINIGVQPFGYAKTIVVNLALQTTLAQPSQ